MKTLFRLTTSIFLVLAAAAAPTVSGAAERSLAGIKTFSPIQIVLARYGDPAFIASGTEIAPVTFGYGKPTLGDPGIDPNATTGGGAGPGFGQGPTSDNATSPQASAGETFDPLYEQGSRYYYNFPRKGLIYEFVATSAGRVIEIKAYGYSGSVKTSLGIGLGSTYADIVLKYGYPEQTTNVIGPNGDELTLFYLQRDHVAFRLIRGRVAVISVVAPD